MVKEDKKVVRRNIAANPVYIFCHPNSPKQKFYSGKYYFHIVQEGPEDTLFVASIDGATGGGTGPAV